MLKRLYNFGKKTKKKQNSQLVIVIVIDIYIDTHLQFSSKTSLNP